MRNIILSVWLTETVHADITFFRIIKHFMWAYDCLLVPLEICLQSVLFDERMSTVSITSLLVRQFYANIYNLYSKTLTFSPALPLRHQNKLIEYTILLEEGAKKKKYQFIYRGGVFIIFLSSYLQHTYNSFKALKTKEIEFHTLQKCRT